MWSLYQQSIELVALKANVMSERQLDHMQRQLESPMPFNMPLHERLDLSQPRQNVILGRYIQVNVAKIIQFVMNFSKRYIFTT